MKDIRSVFDSSDDDTYEESNTSYPRDAIVDINNKNSVQMKDIRSVFDSSDDDTDEESYTSCLRDSIVDINNNNMFRYMCATTIEPFMHMDNLHYYRAPFSFGFFFHSDGEYIVRVPNVDANHHLEIIDAMGLSNNNKEVLLWVWFGENKENLYRCIISVE